MFKAHLALIFFLLIMASHIAQGQTSQIEKLKLEVSSFSGDETYLDKIGQIRQLLDLDPFNLVGTYALFNYYREMKLDSVSLYFQNLKRIHPESTAPHLLQNEFTERYWREDRPALLAFKVENLHQALRINALDAEVLYALSELYYDDFMHSRWMPEPSTMMGAGELPDSVLIAQWKKQDRKTVFDYSAHSALFYFNKLWKADEYQRAYIFFPMKQLECFLSVPERQKLPFTQEASETPCPFPTSYFANLKPNWACDFTTNLLFDVWMSGGQAESIGALLERMKEPCLYAATPDEASESYRFIWLRSFDEPVIIRMEKRDSQYRLTWKVGKGVGGKKLKQKGHRLISATEWDQFKKLMETVRFDDLPNERWVNMTDGATWLLEHKNASRYKAHKTNYPEESIKESCLYLINLTRLRIKKRDIY